MSSFCHPYRNYCRPLDVASFTCTLWKGRGWETKDFTLASANIWAQAKKNGIWGHFQQISPSTPTFLVSVAEPVCVFLALAGSSQAWPGFACLGGGSVTLGWLCCCVRSAAGTPGPCPALPEMPSRSEPAVPGCRHSGLLVLLCWLQILSPRSFPAKGLSVLRGEEAEPKLGNSAFLLLWHENWVVPQAHGRELCLRPK